MKHNISKFLLLVFAFFAFFFFANNVSIASDYKYKVLDPRYNPQAQELIEGKLDTYEQYSQSSSKKFDFGAFLAIFALVIFPFLVLSIAAKTFKRVSNSFKDNTESLSLGNIKINSLETMESQDFVDTLFDKTVAKSDCSSPSVTNAIKRDVNYPKEEKQPVEKIHKVTSASIQKYFSPTIEKIPNPMLLNTSPLTSNKGLCVVEYNKKYSLIGYINDEIFLLEQFDSLNTTEIRSRLTETKNNIDRYIVRLGEYKAVVEVKEQEMKLLLEL